MQLHPEFGVNPTMAACFFCGEETGEIVLLGNEYKGEAPRTMVFSKEPCEKCKENFSKGYVIFEVFENDKEFTGNFLVLTFEAAYYLGFPKTDNNGCSMSIQSFTKLIAKLKELRTIKSEKN